MNKDNETLLRLKLLLSNQIQDLQKYRSMGNNKIYLDAYFEVMKLITLLSDIPDIKLTCHDGKFWKQRDIEKKYNIGRYDFLIDTKLKEKYERERNSRKS